MSVCIFGLTYMFMLVVPAQPHKWQFSLWAKLFSLPSPKFKTHPSFYGSCCYLNIGWKQQKNQNKMDGEII